MWYGDVEYLWGRDGYIGESGKLPLYIYYNTFRLAIERVDLCLQVLDDALGGGEDVTMDFGELRT